MKITPCNELKHILRILESCETILHIQTVEVMFTNFVTKWRNKIDDSELNKYIEEFKEELNKKKNNDDTNDNI